MESLKITVTDGDHGPVLALSGEADVTTVPELAAELAAQVAAGVRHLTVELSGLTFADSSSVRPLIEANDALRAHGGTLELASPQPAVAMILGLLGVDQVIAVRGTAPPPGTRGRGSLSV